MGSFIPRRPSLTGDRQREIVEVDRRGAAERGQPDVTGHLLVPRRRQAIDLQPAAARRVAVREDVARALALDAQANIAADRLVVAVSPEGHDLGELAGAIAGLDEGDAGAVFLADAQAAARRVGD